MIRYRSIFDIKFSAFIVFGIKLFAGVFFYALTSLSISAENSVETPKIFIPNGDGVQRLSVQMEYLEDTDGTYTIEQVASGQAGVFRSFTIKKYIFSYKKRAFWVRFTADFSGYNDPYWFLMQFYEHVGVLTVFYPDVSSGFHAIEFTEDVAPGQRLFNIHNYLFKLPTPKNNPTTYYVRYVPDGHAMDINLLWSSTKGIIEYLSNTHIELGLFFGSLLGMWIYNCVLFFYLRNRTHFYYLYYLGAFIATYFYVTGLAPLVFRVSLWDEKFFAACAYAAGHGMVLFARHFLDLKKSIRWLDSYLIFFQWVLSAGALLCFFLPRGVPFAGIDLLNLFIIPAFVLGGAIRCYQGYQPAYLYFSGWVIFCTGLAIQSLKSIDILPVNFITNYAIHIASVWEAIVFSLALAIRLRVLEKEDIAKSKRLMLQLEKAVEMEKMAVQKKTMFIAAVNHELRTPLQSLTGSIEVLTHMAKSSSMEKYVDKISRASEQITAQMRDIGEYSRLEAGVLTQRDKKFKLSELLGGVVDDFTKMADVKGISLMLKSPNKEVELIGDYDRIRQILNNLIYNAIKFTEAGSVRIDEYIDANLDRQINEKLFILNITILDTGVGISKEKLPNIFDVFTQVGDVTKNRGTGLGLAIVKRIVELLNAEISVESEVNKGTKFTVRIPVNKVNELKELNEKIL